MAYWPNQLHRWIVERIRTWLGINAHERIILDHNDMMLELALQSNDLAHALLGTQMSVEQAKVEAEKLKRRVWYYAEHCDSLGWVHRKFQNILEEERLRDKEK